MMIDHQLQHRLQTRQEDDSLQYEPLSAVVLSEGLKMLISVAGAAPGFYHNAASDSAPCSGFLSYISNGRESSAVPAFLYTLSAADQSIGAYNVDILTYLMLS